MELNESTTKLTNSQSLLGIVTKNWKIFSLFSILGGISGFFYVKSIQFFHHKLVFQTIKFEQTLETPEKINSQLKLLFNNESMCKKFSESYVKKLQESGLVDGIRFISFISSTDASKTLTNYLLNKNSSEIAQKSPLSIESDNNGNYIFSFSSTILQKEELIKIATIFIEPFNSTIYEFNKFINKRLAIIASNKVKNLQTILNSIHYEDKKIADEKVENQFNILNIYKKIQLLNNFKSFNQKNERKQPNFLTLLTDFDDIQLQILLEKVVQTSNNDAFIKKFLSALNIRKLIQEREKSNFKEKNTRREKFESMVSDIISPTYKEEYELPQIITLNSGTPILSADIGTSNIKISYASLFGSSIAMLLCFFLLILKRIDLSSLRKGMGL